jgi:hypothetical protein
MVNPPEGRDRFIVILFFFPVEMAKKVWQIIKQDRSLLLRGRFRITDIIEQSSDDDDRKFNKQEIYNSFIS